MERNNHFTAIRFLVIILLVQRSHPLRTKISSITDKIHGLIGDPLGGFADTASTVMPDIITEITDLVPGDDENSTKTCFEKLGCFGLGKPWTSILRPFPAPWSPRKILASVTLYTRKAPEGYHQLFNTSFRMDLSDYNPQRPRTVFMTHGFSSNGDTEWLHDMKDAYLKDEDANVFIMDWGKGASLINYLQVASNTRIVGAQLAEFIRYLIKNGQNTKDIHLIGHSLGAHIMSYCAKNISEISKVDRLTALDPAQPGFEGTPRKVRLDAGDADNVDVYHTDAKPFLVFLGFGMLAPVGDVDFYFNGGSLQPGCLSVPTPNITSILDLASYPVEVVSSWVSCSHGRATEYFTAALNLRNCSFWGRKMSITESFLKIGTLGRLTLADPVVNALSVCSSDTCSVAGLDTFKLPARGAFSVTTKSEKPFCETSEEERQHLANLLTFGLYDYLPKAKQAAQGIPFLKKLQS